jgi:hypothetical protein
MPFLRIARLKYRGFLTFAFSRSSILEVDTISLPYPHLSYNPFMSVSGVHKFDSRLFGFQSATTTIQEAPGQMIYPILSIGSFESNMEDTHRLFFYDTPIRAKDFE